MTQQAENSKQVSSITSHNAQLSRATIMRFCSPPRLGDVREWLSRPVIHNGFVYAGSAHMFLRVPVSLVSDTAWIGPNPELAAKVPQIDLWMAKPMAHTATLVMPEPAVCPICGGGKSLFMLENLVRSGALNKQMQEIGVDTSIIGVAELDSPFLAPEDYSPSGFLRFDLTVTMNNLGTETEHEHTELVIPKDALADDDNWIPCDHCGGTGSAHGDVRDRDNVGRIFGYYLDKNYVATAVAVLGRTLSLSASHYTSSLLKATVMGACEPLVMKQGLKTVLLMGVAPGAVSHCWDFVLGKEVFDMPAGVVA